MFHLYETPLSSFRIKSKNGGCVKPRWQTQFPPAGMVPSGSASKKFKSNPIFPREVAPRGPWVHSERNRAAEMKTKPNFGIALPHLAPRHPASSSQARIQKTNPIHRATA